MCKQIKEKAKQQCPGCRVNHASQSKHPCITKSWEEKVLTFFDKITKNTFYGEPYVKNWIRDYIIQVEEEEKFIDIYTVD